MITWDGKCPLCHKESCGHSFKDERDLSQQRRARNRENSTKILEKNGIKFTERNNGAHLIVLGQVDFWPGTGKWIDRISHREGRGVFPLINHVNRGDK